MRSKRRVATTDEDTVTTAPTTSKDGRRVRRRVRLAARQLPPPDPATRVELERPARRHETPARRSSAGELTMLAGLAGVFAAASSKFVEMIHLPSSSEVSVAGFGVALVGLGFVQRRRLARQAVDVVAAAPTTAPPAMPTDLPSLTGEIAGVLSQLRQEYGLAYRTATWLDGVLPAVGFTTAQPELVRDMLAVSALDAGGVRADVSALTATHSTADLLEAGSSLLVALEQVCEACARRDIGLGELPNSDQPTWPTVLV